MKTKHLLQLTSTAALTAAVGMAGAAHAASLTQTFDIVEQSTDFTELFEVDKFDSSLGTLQQVIISLEGTIGGSVFAENTGPSDADVTLGLEGEFDLMVGGLNAGDVISLVSQEESLDSFDGAIDFGGDSGVEIDGLSGTESISNVFTSGDAVFNLLAGGPGTVDADFSAIGESAFSGPGNVFNGATTVASGQVNIEYVFEEAPTQVPEPGTAVGVGLAAAAGWLMKKKKAHNA
ncbi:MAG: choice-of-anchor E domain-containing protein [Cyanobacteriota bacterium]|nr:choice-of-anchor E domain-containing protein [Cyanobacteriota bacterium]